MLYVGIDWASDHHDVCLTNDSAQTLAAFRIAHGSQGPPFMSACDPLIQAERRCKARCMDRTRWDSSLAAGRWCPVARCR